MPEAALVAITEHETFDPTRTLVATVSLEPTRVQPLPVTANVTAPVPLPLLPPQVPLEK